MRKVLVATTNKGKYNEFVKEFTDLDLEFVSLKDVGLDKIDLEEPHETLWENALHKAKFFAKKSKLLTIAEDSGMFVDFLKGDLGVESKRYAGTATARLNKVLNAMKNVPQNKRGAYFACSGCIYDPKNNNFSIFNGKVKGIINNKRAAKARQGMDYDAIFYYPPAKKTFAEISLHDKNLVSHRGQVVTQIKIFLQRHFDFKQFFVPVAFIVRDRKVLLNKRRDPRPEFNNVWESPGGAIEKGESVEAGLKREVKEETGYTVEIIEQIPKVYTAHNTKTDVEGNYQVFGSFFICKIKSGKYGTNEGEVSDYGWFTIDEVKKLSIMPLNRECLLENEELLRKYIN